MDFYLTKEGNVISPLYKEIPLEEFLIKLGNDIRNNNIEMEIRNSWYSKEYKDFKKYDLLTVVIKKNGKKTEYTVDFDKQDKLIKLIYDINHKFQSNYTMEYYEINDDLEKKVITKVLENNNKKLKEYNFKEYLLHDAKKYLVSYGSSIIFGATFLMSLIIPELTGSLNYAISLAIFLLPSIITTGVLSISDYRQIKKKNNLKINKNNIVLDQCKDAIEEIKVDPVVKMAQDVLNMNKCLDINNRDLYNQKVYVIIKEYAELVNDFKQQRNGQINLTVDANNTLLGIRSNMINKLVDLEAEINELYSRQNEIKPVLDDILKFQDHIPTLGEDVSLSLNKKKIVK